MKDLITSLSELVKIESVKAAREGSNAPFGKKIREALDYCLELGKQMGLKINDIDGYAGEIEFGEGAQQDTIGILAHLDVVPLGEGWTHEQGAIENDTIYGRGVVDDKGPALCVLYAMHELKEEGFVPSKPVRLILGCDEESGSECMEYYKKKGRMPKVGFSPDADFPVVTCEKTILHIDVLVPISETYKMSILELGGGLRPNMVPDRARLVIEKDAMPASITQTFGAHISDDGEILTAVFKGVSAHGSKPEEGENALWKLFGFLNKYLPNDNIFAINYYLMNNAALKNLGLNIKDQKSGEQTINVGVASIEDNYIKLTLDMRCPISQTKENIVAALKEKLPQGTKVQVKYHMPYLYVDENSFLVKALLSAYEQHTKQKGYGKIIGGGTYARHMQGAVAFGPTFDGQETRIHNVDEFITIKNLMLCKDIYKTAIKNLTQK